MQQQWPLIAIGIGIDFYCGQLGRLGLQDNPELEIGTHPHTAFTQRMGRRLRSDLPRFAALGVMTANVSRGLRKHTPEQQRDEGEMANSEHEYSGHSG